MRGGLEADDKKIKEYMRQSTFSLHGEADTEFTELVSLP
jgi:hypothetical protein